MVELKEIIQENAIEVAIFDDELTPMQQRHIENELQVKILDRTSLVLDIFSQRKNQRSTNTNRTRPTGIFTTTMTHVDHLSRLGGIGTRGPGETQLEVDRRQIGRRIQN